MRRQRGYIQLQLLMVINLMAISGWICSKAIYAQSPDADISASHVAGLSAALPLRHAE